MTARILATSPLVGPYLAELGQRFPTLDIAPHRSIAWKMGLPHAEVLIVTLSEPITDDELAMAPKLRVIGTFSAGTNHLPMAACQRRGIKIVNTPNALTDATADLALALLLAVTRRIKEGEILVRSGTWKGWGPDQLLGTSLAGKTCGILGAGAIGKAFAKRVWALGMKPVFWDREGKRVPVDFGAAIAKRLPLRSLLPESAVLSLHCPLTDQTRGLIGEEAISMLPPGAILINTARGGIVDEQAALKRLLAGKLGGVGLDVYEHEPRVAPAWFDAPSTVLTPHLGSATRETRLEMARLLCEGISQVLDQTAG